VWWGLSEHEAWECPFISDYDEPFQKHASEFVSNSDIDADFPLMQRENLHRRNRTLNAYLHIAR
jgi:hypothetical protein